MATALVTGGTGFIGSHVTRILAEAGHKVRILRRPRSRLALVEDLRVDHAIGDVLDVDSLTAAMEGCEWVFHTAAVADYWRAARVDMYLINVHGTRAVLDAAHKAGVRRVILTSSAAAVGLRPDGLPADESLGFNFPPDRFPYGHSKALAEAEARRALLRGQEVVILNPTVVFGPGDLNMISGSMVVEFAKGIVPPFYPPGAVTVIDVRDVARAHLAAAEKGRSGERYLLGAEDIAYRELFALIAQMVDARPPAFPYPVFAAGLMANGIEMLKRLGLRLPIDGNQVWLSARNVCFACDKAHRELGKPLIGLPQSLADTYAWYVARGKIAR